MNIELTTDWPHEKIAVYHPQITAAFAKLAEQYPHDVSVRGLAEAAISGAQQLWLVREGEEFKSFCLTETKTNDATGYKSVVITSLAGEGGQELAPLVAEVEKWAASIGANEVQVVGRWGWKRGFEREGYRMDAILLRKAL